MSFWDNIKSSIDAAAASAASGIDYATASAASAYNDMMSFPDQAQCTWTDCLHTTHVPPSTFQWQCVNSHQNTPTVSVCAVPGCGATKAQSKTAGLYRPTILCEACQRPITLSETKAETGFWETLYTTPYHAERLVGTAVDSAKELAAAPKTFPCRHCGVQLFSPQGAWTCTLNGCNTHNGEGVFNCTTCGVHRYAAGVICAVCNRSTPVAGSNLAANLDQFIDRSANIAKSSYSYLSGGVYCHCDTCRSSIELQKEQVRLILGLSPNDLVPGFDQDAVTPPLDTTGENTADDSIAAGLLGDAPQDGDNRPQNTTTGGQEQQVLCQKCLHVNTVDKSKILSRQIQKPTLSNLNLSAPLGLQGSTAQSHSDTINQQQPPTLEQQIAALSDEDQRKYNLIKSYRSLSLVDPVTNTAYHCTGCQATSSYYNQVLPCFGCHTRFCRKCAPYTRRVAIVDQSRQVPFCYDCANAFDQQAATATAATAANQQQQQHHAAAQNTAAASAPATVPAPATAAHATDDDAQPNLLGNPDQPEDYYSVQ